MCESSKGTDENVQLCRFILALAARTCDKEQNLTGWLNVLTGYTVYKGSGLKAPAEPSRAELPTRRVKFLFSKTSSEEINHKYFLYKINT